jgi:hypothetical protein
MKMNFLYCVVRVQEDGGIIMEKENSGEVKKRDIYWLVGKDIVFRSL